MPTHRGAASSPWLPAILIFGTTLLVWPHNEAVLRTQSSSAIYYQSSLSSQLATGLIASVPPFHPFILRPRLRGGSSQCSSGSFPRPGDAPEVVPLPRAAGAGAGAAISDIDFEEERGAVSVEVFAP
jgi:hypothetical protein